MTEKRKKKDKPISIEELYRNKNFVPPKEKNLETIFEEPRKSKDGVPVLTSVKKFKRYLHFDTTVGKIHKRKVRAKKCIKKMKLGNLRTRSAGKVEECQDISLYISEALGESSDSEMDTTDKKININDDKESTPTPDSPRTAINDSTNDDPESDSFKPNVSTSTEDDLDSRNSSLKSSDFFPSDTPSNTEQSLPNERSDIDEALENEEEQNDSPRSSCSIT